MDETVVRTPRRRPAKEAIERAIGSLLVLICSPVLVGCAVAIKLEGLLSPDARGSVLFKETRISRGREIDLLKFRILKRSALAELDPTGPTHIKRLEKDPARTTRVGRWLKRWYLDELPQLLNIARGDMFLVGTRPFPIELYEREMSRGITRKRDMPAGLVGPVQSRKGDDGAPNGIDLDAHYWEAYCEWPTWKLLLLDLRIIGRSIRVQLEHRGL